MFRLLLAAALLAGACLLAGPAPADDAASLRLVPFPKEVRLTTGTLRLDRPLVLSAGGQDAPTLVRLIGEELRRAGLPVPALRALPGAGHALRLSPAARGPVPPLSLRPGAGEEEYALVVRPDGVLARSPGTAGLVHAAQTLCQLIRANRRGNSLPCLSIHDWPSLRWRAFQDDLTRGPSSTAAELQREVALGSYLRMNVFTYYMEYQYAFGRHPKIGPPRGSLKPAELKTLVEQARPLGVEILGNQQSFAHLEHVLSHPEYAALGEDSRTLTPAREETYRLLDDLYTSVIPLLPFPFFNVCCDETSGLGTGPAREMAKELGVGGVYVHHIQRVRELVKGKYGKEMMMWGDIILQHPDQLEKIPKDVVMLTWGYDPRESFEAQILPFARSGYRFWVCPGVNNWGRILPDFAAATTNIRNFTRDGATLGAQGMLNTAWDDDGTTLNAPNWHGFAWGAECAWNASTTRPEEFQHRLGAVLFGEKGDHFGQAIALLAKLGSRSNSEFFRLDAGPFLVGSIEEKRAELAAHPWLATLRPAIAHLEACRKEATANAELLDAFLHGARRLALMVTREQDRFAAAVAYRKALGQPPARADAFLAEAEARVRRAREGHAAAGEEFRRLWLRENRPYALDWTLNAYDRVLKRYDALLARLAVARHAAAAGKPLPDAPAALEIQALVGGRAALSCRQAAAPLQPQTPWEVAEAGYRLGLVVSAGNAERTDLPLELDLQLPPETAARPARAFRVGEDGALREIPAQLEPTGVPGRTRLILLVEGPIAQDASATLWVYLGLAQAPAPSPRDARATDGPNGAKWLENDQVRLLLGPEGAHLFRWEVKALGDRDLTMPGEEDWHGFSDIAGEHRRARNTLRCAARGPALVRYVCDDGTGLRKTISLFAGMPWAEVILNRPVSTYWEIDGPANFAADGPTPGTYLFSNGASGAVRPAAAGMGSQVLQGNVTWGIKHNREGLALGLATPEVAAAYRVGPGGGMGGVGIEASPPARHFITFAGVLHEAPEALMSRLARTLDLRNPPGVVAHAVQARP